MGGSLEVRISDADRRGVVDRLNQAYADGRITFDEHHERVDLALAALTRRDARAITRDLPRATGGRKQPQSRLRPPRLFLKANTVLWAIWGTEVLLGNTSAGDLWPLIVTVPWAALIVIERAFLPRRPAVHR